MHHISSTLKNTGDRTHTQPCKRETMLGFCIFLKVLLCSLAPYSCDGNEMEHIRGMLALVTGFFSKRLCFFFELGVLPSKRGRCFQSFHAIKHLLEFVLLWLCRQNPRSCATLNKINGVLSDRVCEIKLFSLQIHRFLDFPTVGASTTVSLVSRGLRAGVWWLLLFGYVATFFQPRRRLWLPIRPVLMCLLLCPSVPGFLNLSKQLSNLCILQ